MTNGLAFKAHEDRFAVDIHYNGTACSGYSQKTTAIKNVLDRWVRSPDGWNKDCYEKYAAEYIVIAPMFLIRWEDE